MKSEEAEIWSHELLVAQTIEDGKLGYVSGDDIEYIDHGRQKYVYKVNGACFHDSRIHGDVLAVAIPRQETIETFPLEREFHYLETIHDALGNKYTPEPLAYVRTKDAKLLLMEYIPFPTIGTVKQDLDDRALAYLLGDAFGRIYAATGLVHEEPHDKNILVGTEGEIKIIDAIHFRRGSIEDLFRPFQREFKWDRAEVNRFPDDFRQGLYDAGVFRSENH